MPKHESISREAGDLLLELLEHSDPILSLLALRDHVAGAGAELLQAGVLERWGSELAATDGSFEGDRMVSVTPSPEGDGYGYFSGTGWTSIPETELASYKVDLNAALGIIGERIQWKQRRAAQMLTPDLFIMGSARILRRGPLMEVWFARRLGEENVWKAMVDHSQRRPASRLRAVVTSTPAELLRDLSIPGHMFIWVGDVVTGGDGLRIDPEILSARCAGRPAVPPDTPLYLSEDGGTLIIRGTDTIRFKSSIHISIIRMLVEGYVKGCGYRTADLLAKAHSNAGALHRAFSRQKWTQLQPYLHNDDGIWSFEL